MTDVVLADQSLEVILQLAQMLVDPVHLRGLVNVDELDIVEERHGFGRDRDELRDGRVYRRDLVEGEDALYRHHWTY